MDRVALVTGGSSGIGRAVVIQLALMGCKVLFTYRSKAGAQQTEQLVQDFGGVCEAIQCDIADIHVSAAMVKDIVDRYGKLDVLVNCAGISNTKTIEEIDEAEWDRMMRVNLKGTFFLTKNVFEQMKRFGGRIISLTSIAGQRGGRFSGIHYCVSKGGVETMMKCFALQGAPYGITANSVSPGVVETPMTKAEGVRADDVPLGRMAQPKEVAAVVGFLASEQAAYLTGTTIDVNGGQLMR